MTGRFYVQQRDLEQGAWRMFMQEDSLGSTLYYYRTKAYARACPMF